MSQHFLTPDRLYDRPFAAAHPFARSPSAGRRIGMLLVFFLLCCIIGGYLFVTDAQRVRRLAESELSRLVGAPVTVGRAKLSIFEGLRLEFVNVYVDNSTDDDSILFSTNTFLVNYDLRALLAGRLRLTQLIAIDPQVQLVEDLDTGKWNYQRLNPPASSTPSRTSSGGMPALPEIILRNAMINYSETRNGKQISRGSMAIEGQLAPSSDGQRYSFELQSRGGASPDGSFAMGPTVNGALNRDSGQVTASLKDFQFGRDIRSMLPAQVRAWWDRHGLAGAVDVPVLVFTPAAAAGKGESSFQVVTNLRGVKLTVRPEEWMSREEIQAQQWAALAFDSLRGAGLNSAGVVDCLAKLVEPAPIQLGEVTGAFEFNENGVTLRELHGSLEKNAFTIDGRIEGYSPLSPATIKISADRIEIPETPHYITSMPRQVRELYDHLRPRGQCALKVAVDRPSTGARIEVAGEVSILDGNFVFDKFPYPVSSAVGKIIFGYDAVSGMDQVRLVGLKGKGAAGGPNANSIIRLSGVIGPLTGDAGVEVTVACDDVQDEPLLMDSFPPEVRSALHTLDADGKGEFPKYRGGFECRIHRPPGPKSLWIIDTDVDLRDAAGKMVAFPYFMEHVTGRLAIREGYVDIIGATMKKNDSSLVIDGRVTWRAGVGGRALEPGEIQDAVTKSRPDLKITARNVPIDKALLDALPEDRRLWLQKAGLTGKIDIDGRVWRPSAAEMPSLTKSSSDSELTHSFDIALRDGTIWPSDGTFAISGLAARLHLLPDRLIISDMVAKRGDADLTGRGEVSWPQNNPAVFFSGTATKLELDRTLYKILPAAAQQGWDAVKPEGVVDLDLTYRGGVAIAGPTTKPSPPDIDLIIHPRQLAATVQAVPYRLSDIKGVVRVTGSKVTLTDLSGKHNDATVRLAGSGTIDKHSEWDLHISAQDVPIDHEFRRALPAALASLVESMKLKGVVSFEFPRLSVRMSSPSDSAPATTAPEVAPDGAAVKDNPLDVDFAVKLGLDDASFDVGVPIERAHGAMELSGSVRRGKLAALEGPIDFEELTIATRHGRKIHADLYKPSDQQALRIGSINGQLAGGEIAGGVDLVFPDDAPSRYVMNLILRNADLRELTGQTEKNLSGELSASLALEGDWSDARSRRGRGDVAVRGREMYKMPLVLGLLQITNLTLPITSPFNEGGARYSVEGQTVTFESLELRSNSMLMSGSGQLDFGTKKVRMSFTTDNPNWPKVPILGDIVQTAKHELLQIHVKGTLEVPKVSATAINTFTTTVDEVLRGDQQR